MLNRFSIASVAAAAAFLSLMPAMAHAGTQQIDPVHSNTAFRIHHFNAGYVLGLITNPTGTVEYDAANPEATSFDVTVDVSKLYTGNDKRDEDLKGPDWFNVKQFPTMTFKSTSVKKDGDKLAVTGDFTLHGVTKSITVPMTMTGEGKGMKGETRTGFLADFTVDRTEFDLKTYPGAVGNDVTITVALETIAQ